MMIAALLHLALLAEPALQALASEPASMRAEPSSLAAASQPVAVAAPDPTSGVPQAGLEPTIAVGPASAPTKPPETTIAPAQRTAVSAAINADQAALTGTAKKPWSVLLNFNTSLGIGTFLSAQTPMAAYVGSTLTVEPAYVLNVTNTFRMRVSARESLRLEYTPPDDPSGRRFDWSDLLLGASARLYKIPKIDVDLWGSYRMPIPLSLDSIQAGLITGIITGAGASRNFDWAVKGDWRMSLTVRYDFVFRKNFNRFNVPIYRATNDPYAPTLHTRASDSLIDGGIARGAANTRFSFTNALTVSWTPWEIVSVSVFASIANAFRYPITDQPDFYTPPDAIAGPGRFDMVRTNIDVTVSVLPQLMLSAGVFNAAPPFAPDNRTLYNPFVNTQSAANNYTQLYTSLTAVL
jgi:hypothetical protein